MIRKEYSQLQQQEYCPRYSQERFCEELCSRRYDFVGRLEREVESEIPDVAAIRQ
jgi:hypothetical protein